MYFNSRPSARGDLDWVLSSIKNIISIHAPPRGATRCSQLYCEMFAQFQFTPLREGRRDLLHLTGGNKIFQFTPLREGRLLQVGQRFERGYFNSRPSARGDLVDVKPGVRGVISIHAPPRGATFRALRQNRYVLFQFTPLREGRPTPR